MNIHVTACHVPGAVLVPVSSDGLHLEQSEASHAGPAMNRPSNASTWTKRQGDQAASHQVLPAQKSYSQNCLVYLEGKMLHVMLLKPTKALAYI